MILKPRLPLALGLALAVGASAQAAPSGLYQKLFKPGIPDQMRSDALGFALAAAWQARGCTSAPELAEVLAAGLARETDAARFERKLGLAVEAGCGAAPATGVAASTPEAASAPDDPALALIARVAAGHGSSAKDETTGYASFEALKAAPTDEPAAADNGQATTADKPPSKEEEARLRLQAVRDRTLSLLSAHEQMSNPDYSLEEPASSICPTVQATLSANYQGPKRADGTITRPHNLARCSNLVYQELARGYQAVVEGVKAIETLTKDSKPDPKVMTALKTLALDLQPRVEYAAALEAATRSANYGLYVGPSQVLQDDGEWKEGSEFLARFNTEVFDSENTGYTLCVFTASWCRGYTDISYTSPGTVPKEAANPALPPNPFKQEGTLRVRAGILSHANPWFGMEYGIGLSSPIQDQNGFSRVEPMARVGAHFQTLYSDGVVGELSVGLAHDRARTYLIASGPADHPVYRQQDEFNRVYLEGTVLFPRAEILGGWRLAGRLSMDAPINGDSEAEVRASVLVYYPLSSWLDTFKPVQAKPNK